MNFKTVRKTYGKSGGRHGARGLLAFAMTVLMLLSLSPTALAYNSEDDGFDYIRTAAPFLQAVVSEQPMENGYTSTRDFIDLNLYDYRENINDRWERDKKFPGFQWNGGAYEGSRGTGLYIVDAIDFGNSKITDYDYSGTDHGKSATSTLVGNRGGDINRLDTSAGVTNRPVGMSTGTQALSNRLVDGYPALTDGSSLAWLFTENEAVDKLNTQSIDGLFKQDSETGTYSYNSRENHAQYSDDMFIRYDQIITPNFIIYPFGNFLPLNSIKEGSTQVSDITNIGEYISSTQARLSNDATDEQLSHMLALYEKHLKAAGHDDSSAGEVLRDFISSGRQDSPGSTAGIPDSHMQRMYNIDWDVDTNFFFGMDMSMNFMMPKDGYTGSSRDVPMVFSFTGDDDVWVYIDGALFLDLSGIHRHVGGKIDFVNGMVYYYALNEESGDVDMDALSADDSGAYAAYSFEELLRAAGKDSSALNENGSFKNYSSHEFKFYYMERGSGSSVCRINFNFPLLRQNSISVEKEVSGEAELLGDPEYSFRILKAGGEELFIGPYTMYSVYDGDNVLLREGSTDENGVFRLRAGERAEFSGISENAGSYYVQELFEGGFDFEQYARITVSGEVSSIENNVLIAGQSFVGMDSPARDASEGAALFHFLNTVDVTGLGSLSIAKSLEGAEAGEEDFAVTVLLDGAELPEGTEYSLSSQRESRVVEQAGTVLIPAGERATISGILAGTGFLVEEQGTEGYDVSYSIDGGDYLSEAPKGRISTGKTANVTVRNSLQKLPQTGWSGAGRDALDVAEEPGAGSGECMGSLSIPALELELPVISRWSYEALESAPCRYSGSIDGGDLVLLAHNYARHFGRLDELKAGDELIFTDFEGREYRYALAEYEILEPWERERLCSGEYELSLFTCTDDSLSRLVARFERLTA